jgi:hypothetical protein
MSSTKLTAEKDEQPLLTSPVMLVQRKLEQHIRHKRNHALRCDRRSRSSLRRPAPAWFLFKRPITGR